MTVMVVIAGCRHYSNYDEAKSFIEENLNDFLLNNDSVIILSGGCKGADALGERFSFENDLQVEKHIAHWDLYGRAAGPKRNKEMVDDCDRIICFWDGTSKGTQSTINYAKKINKDIRIKYIDKKTKTA